jgi:hypothetical protein
MMPGALVSIMRFYPDINSLSPMPNSRFSERFSRAMQNIPVSDGIGTCGTAALTKCMVITEDIQKDPRWDGYRDIAEAEGLAACWSMPILTSGKELLGTFCHFYRAPAIPTSEAQRNLIQSAALVALAILRHRDTEDLLILSERQITCRAFTLISLLNPVIAIKPRQRSTKPEMVKPSPTKPWALTRLATPSFWRSLISRLPSRNTLLAFTVSAGTSPTAKSRKPRLPSRQPTIC